MRCPCSSQRSEGGPALASDLADLAGEMLIKVPRLAKEEDLPDL